jgi:hypothetical protein
LNELAHGRNFWDVHRSSTPAASDPAAESRPVLTSVASRHGVEELIMRCLGAIALLSLLLLGSISAHAHSIFLRASPGVGSTVHAAPREVAIWFTQQLEPSFSTVAVTNAAGERVDTGDVRVSGNVLRVSLRPIGAGTYWVRWRVLSVDTHTTQGAFHFHVRQ